MNLVAGVGEIKMPQIPMPNDNVKIYSALEMAKHTGVAINLVFADCDPETLVW